MIERSQIIYSSLTNENQITHDVAGSLAYREADSLFNGPPRGARPTAKGDDDLSYSIL
jgi:hypothetical protein